MMKRFFPDTTSALRDEAGQALVLAVLGMVAVVGMLGLAIDMGNLRAARRKLQEAADAAAIAGALELSYCTYSSGSACPTMENAAASAVTENGLSTPVVSTDSCSTPYIRNTTLVLNWGPCLVSSDPNKNSQSVVEAEVGHVYPLYFAGLLGISPVTLTARAEATHGNSGYCMYVDAKDYGTTGTGSLDLQSGGHLTLSCGIQDNGSLSSQGNGSHVGATQFEVSASTGAGSNQFSPAPSFNAPQVHDPICAVYYGSLSSDSTTGACSSQTTYQQPTCSSWTVLTGAVSGTLPPGCYSAPSTGCTPVDVKNNGYGNDVNTYCDAVTLNGNLTLQPSASDTNALYVFNGDLDLGGYNLTGGDGSTYGVTMYFQGGSIINGNGSQVMLYAPSNNATPDGGSATVGTTGYQSMLVWQAPDDANTMELASGSTSIWTGTIYVPDGMLDLSDGANAQSGCTPGIYSIIDAYSVEDAHGSKTFNLCDDYSTLVGGDPIKAYTAVLVE